jgi:hypothetical protein
MMFVIVSPDNVTKILVKKKNINNNTVWVKEYMLENKDNITVSPQASIAKQNKNVHIHNMEGSHNKDLSAMCGNR